MTRGCGCASGPWRSAVRSGSSRACSTASVPSPCGCLLRTAHPPDGPDCGACTASPLAAAGARAWQSLALWSSRTSPPRSAARM